jgi:hypothetical protein
MSTNPGTGRNPSSGTDKTSSGGDLDSGPKGRFLKTGCWVVIAVVVLLVAALWFGPVRWAREAAVACQCQCPLNQLLLAMHNYHDTYGCLPPAYVAGESGEPMHSWRVLILPFVEQRELYSEYDFDEPWNGPNNRQLADRMPHIFHCASEPESNTCTNYVVIRGPGTAFPDGKSTSFEDFRDGLHETILLAEIASSSIGWLEPRDLDVRQMSFSVNDETKPSISCSRRIGPYVVLADSIHCRRLSESLAPEALGALTTIAGQEPMYVAEVDNVGLTSPAPGPATDAALKRWNQWKGLRSLWLSRSPVTDAAFGELAAAADLSTIYLHGTRITDEGLKHFGRQTDVHTLDLSATQVTDVGLEYLKGLTEPWRLNFDETPVTTAGVVRLLEPWPQASIRFSLGSISHHDLNWEGSFATDADVLLCRGLTGISSVNLSRTKITDTSLQVLGGMPGLRNLRLDETETTDAGLEHLADLKELSSLSLAHTQVTDTGIKRLNQWKTLRYLDLAGTQITDVGVEHLKELSELWALNLSETAVTDAGIKHLAALLQLHRLMLNGTQVSDTGLEYLGTLNRFTLLELRGTRVSDDGVCKIEKASPRAEVVR